MLKSPLLFAVSVLVMLFSWATGAEAKEDSLALSFSLPPTHTLSSAQQHSAKAITPIPSTNTTLPAEQLLPAEQPLEFKTTPLDQLSRPQETLRAISEGSDSTKLRSRDTGETKAPTPEKDIDDIGIWFSKNTLEVPTNTAQQKANDNGRLSNGQLNALETTYETLGLNDWMFEGGSGSLVAHTVGSAEGTRYWNGQKTYAYYGHTDPGNGVWNLGTFSYQHDASDPEDADRKQLRRLKRQGDQLQQQAKAQGIQLSLKEKLNGLDLANQAPLAALGKGGYIERLAQAYRLQMDEAEAIAWARTWAYIDPKTQTWNAPGLGNNLSSISQDQERRIAAIDKAMNAYEQTSHPEFEMASLDRFHIEGSGLTDSKLSVSPASKPPFGTVAEGFEEEFELAASDVIGSEISKEASILNAALDFELPSADSEATENDALSASVSESTAEPKTAIVSESQVEVVAASPVAGMVTNEVAIAEEDEAIAPKSTETATGSEASDPEASGPEASDPEASGLEGFNLEAFDGETAISLNSEQPAQQKAQAQKPTLASLISSIPERETGEADVSEGTDANEEADVAVIAEGSELVESEVQSDSGQVRSLLQTQDKIVSPE